MIENHIKLAIEQLLKSCGSSIEEFVQQYLRQFKSKSTGKKYLSVKEAEQYTGLSRFSLIRASSQGKIVAYKLSQARSGKVLYDKSSIDKWITSCRSPP